MKCDEFSLIAHDCPHIYVTGDDDDQSQDLRIAVVNDGVIVHIDLPPKRMAALRDMIGEALESLGLCDHGINREVAICVDCDKAFEEEEARFAADAAADE